MKLNVKFNQDTQKYELYQITDDHEYVNLGECIPKKYPKDKSGIIYKLPDNPYGRQWLGGSKICDNLDLEPRAERILSSEPSSHKTSTKSLLEYLTPEEKDVYDELMVRCKERYDEAHTKKPLTDLEKAQRALERAQAKVAELLAKGE